MRGIKHGILFKKGSFLADFLLIGSCTLLSIFLDPEIPVVAIYILVFAFIICVVLGAWMLFSLKYVLYQDHLYVRGDPFRFKIKYEDIYQIEKTKNIFVENCLLSSKQAVAISYRGLLGDVKISPKNRDLFIEELTERCGHL